MRVLVGGEEGEIRKGTFGNDATLPFLLFQSHWKLLEPINFDQT